MTLVSIAYQLWQEEFPVAKLVGKLGKHGSDPVKSADQWKCQVWIWLLMEDDWLLYGAR